MNYFVNLGMMKKIILSLSVVFFLLCCKKPGSVNFTAASGGAVIEPVMQETNPQEQSDTVGVKTYLALGDSYTFGESVTENQRLPVQVSSQLNGLGIRVSAPEIIARSGWTTGDLLDKLNTEPPLLTNYNIVTLLIGVNNQYRGRKVEEYIPGFESLLKQAIQFAGNDTGHIIVLSIPDWGVTPFAEGRDRKQIAREIDQFNSANETIAKKYNVHYINVTESTREAVSDKSLLASDGLHPSAKEYGRWAKKVAAFIQEKL